MNEFEHDKSWGISTCCKDNLCERGYILGKRVSPRQQARSALTCRAGVVQQVYNKLVSKPKAVCDFVEKRAPLADAIRLGGSASIAREDDAMKTWVLLNRRLR